MTDTTDLSKLSSDELISKLVDVALGCSDVYFYDEKAKAKVHALTVVLKQAVIREASVGTIAIKKDPVDGFPLVDDLTLTHCRDLFAWTKYDLIPRETP